MAARTWLGASAACWNVVAGIALRQRWSSARMRATGAGSEGTDSTSIAVVLAPSPAGAVVPTQGTARSATD